MTLLGAQLVMFKLDGKSLFKNQCDYSLIDESLRFRLNEGLPAGLKVLADADKTCSLAKDIAQKISDVSKVVILATGGSSLGGQAVCALSAYRKSQSAPSVEFWENIDPKKISLSLESIDFNNTAFIAISKSGETPEILAQTIIVINKFLLSKAGKKGLLSKRFFAVTESDQSSLAKLASQHAVSVFPHPKDVGGRFSVFSIVGILPTIIAGLDASALCNGACDTIKALKTQGMAGQNLKASIYAVAQKLSEAKEGTGKSINAFVLMHYGEMSRS
jgi:glucose-6-phosphate isomerase